MGSERHLHMNNLFHLAKIRDAEQLTTLLEDGVKVNRVDSETGSNALHFLYSEVCLSEECQLEVAKCTELLLNHGINLNLPNGAGDVPLHLALAKEWNKSARLLVLSGADLTVTLKDEGKEMLATYLAGLQPDVLHELLDQDVSVDNEQDHLLRVDFRNILQYHDPRGKNPNPFSEMGVSATEKNFTETAFLHSISQLTKKTKLFEHPLLLLFLSLKYHKLQPVILLSFCWHAAIVILYTFYAYFVYVDACPFEAYNKLKLLRAANESTAQAKLKPSCEISAFLKVTSAILSLLWASMMINEVQIWLYRGRTAYFTKRTLPWLIFYVLIPITLWPSLGSSDEYILKWRYPVAAFNVFLIWALCLEHFRKIQQLAVLYDLFLSIALKIFKLTCLFIPLFVGFTIALFIMDAEGVGNWYSIITVIGFMIGDMKYDDLFNEEKQRESSRVYTLCANTLYLLFILFMSVVFVNYILAVTISDISVSMKEFNAACQRLYCRKRQELYAACEKSQTRNKIQLMYIFDRLKLTRRQVIPEKLIRQGRFEYILDVRHPPPFVDRELVGKLRQLAVKRGCNHNRTERCSVANGGGSFFNSSSSFKSASAGSLPLDALLNTTAAAELVGLNSEEDTRIIHEALFAINHYVKIIETKLKIKK